MARLNVRLLGLTLGVAAFVCLTATTVPAQSRLKYVPAKVIGSVDGADVYAAYCASCHGPAGLGNGPAARLLEEAPADLTLIVVRDGRFDRVHVMHHVGLGLGGQRNSNMPDWPGILTSVYGNGGTHLVTRNLAMHIESLQRQ